MSALSLSKPRAFDRQLKRHLKCIGFSPLDNYLEDSTVCWLIWGCEKHKEF